MNSEEKKGIKNDWWIALGIFLIAVAVRFIPELKAGHWPIGYDTFNTYVVDINTVSPPFLNWLKTANLLYFFLYPFKAAGLEPNFIVKIFGPLLYGGLAVSFFYFLRRGIRLSAAKSFAASMLVILQLATLRMSWDLYRNELSLIFLFLALIHLPKIEKTKNLVWFTIFSVLVVLSNQLVTVILAVIILAFFLKNLVQKKFEGTINLLLPAALVGVLFFIVISTSGSILFPKNVLFAAESKNFGFYFYQYKKEMSYEALSSSIFTLYKLLFGILTPFAIYGLVLLRRNLILMVMTLWLLAGTFSSLLFAGTGLIVWDRWLIMLAFPLAIFTVEAISHLGSLAGKIKKWSKKYPKLAWSLATPVWLVIFAFLFFRDLPFLTQKYASVQPPLADDLINNYFPRTMVHNSIGLWKVENTEGAVKWLDAYARPGSVVLVDNRYRGPVLSGFDLSNRSIITNSWSESVPSSSLQMAKDLKFTDIYLIWGTYTTVPSFDRVFASGEIGIYRYMPPTNPNPVNTTKKIKKAKTIN